MNETSCLHVRIIHSYTLCSNRALHLKMSIFSLVKGDIEHEVFEMRIDRWRSPE